MKLTKACAIYEVIDPQHQVIARCTTRELAERYMREMEVPYKEFYRINVADVIGGIDND